MLIWIDAGPIFSTRLEASSLARGGFSMRKLILALIACAFLVVGPVGLASAAEPGIAVSYEQCGFDGELFIANAHGQPFYAIDSAGRTVASGVVDGPWFSVNA